LFLLIGAIGMTIIYLMVHLFDLQMESIIVQIIGSMFVVCGWVVFFLPKRSFPLFKNLETPGAGE